MAHAPRVPLIPGHSGRGGTAISTVRGITPRRAGAFTLIELLVVIGIIVILASLLFPALSHLRERATGPVCVAKLQNLWRVWNNYMVENNQQLYRGTGHWIAEMYSKGVLTSPDETTCPAASSPGSPNVGHVNDPAAWVNKPVGYSINMPTFYYFSTGIKSTWEFTRKTQTPLFMDGMVYAVTAGAWADEAIWSERIRFRHGDRANFVFVDGHAETLNREQVRGLNYRVNSEP